MENGVLRQIARACVRAALGWWATTVPLAASWKDPEMGRPIVQSYGPTDYGSTAFNWCVVSDSTGRVYVGNEQILEFDGRKWQEIEMGNSHLVRALAVDAQDRVWVGAVNELGYLERLPSGERVFKSLRAYLPQGLGVLDLWYVFCLGEKVVFVGSSKVLVWDGIKFQARAFETQNRLLAFRFRGKLAISAGIKDGNLLFDGEKYEPIGIEGCESGILMWASEAENGDALLGGGPQIVKVTRGKVVKVESEANEFLTKNYHTGAVRLKDGTTCVGTIYGGMLIVDDDGQPIRVLNRKSGLPSQSVMSLHLDAKGVLWIPTTRSVMRMDSIPEVSLFDQVNGLTGGISQRLLKGNSLGLLSLSEESVMKLTGAQKWNEGATFSRLKNLERLYWDGINTRQGSIVLGGFVHLDEVTQDTVRAVSEKQPDVVRLYPGGAGSSDFWAISDVGLKRYRYQDGNYTAGSPLFTFDEFPRDSLMDPKQVVWATTQQRGIFAISTVSEEIPAIRHFERGVELPDRLKSGRLFRLGEKVYVYDGNLAVCLNSGSLVPEPGVAHWNLSFVEQEGGTDAIAVGNEKDGPARLLRISLESGKLHVMPLDRPEVRAVGKPINIERPDASGNVWISGSEGLLRVTPEGLKPFSPPAAPSLFSIKWTTNETTSNLPLLAKPVVVFAPDSILSIEVRDPLRPLEKDVLLQTRVVGLNELWQTSNGTATYAGLREGDYVFQARTLAASDTPSEVATYAFTVKPPWQRSTAAYGLYGLLALTGIWGAVNLRLRQVAVRNAQLKQLVDERTDALTRATAAKSAFLANMGHEILNPLNGVVGLVDNLRGGGLRSDQEAAVNQLANCATQLVSVVEDVLEFSRIEAGTVTVRLRSFRIGDPVEAAVDIFRAVQHKQAAPIVIEAGNGILDTQVFGAPDRVRQILVNYVSNAMKFGQGSQVTLAVEKEDSGSWVFRVTDRGPGIPVQEQSGLFHRFHRAKAARRSEIPGTGLGLAACKAYAEAMGGEVWLQSTEGQGASFFLRVPMRDATPADSAATVVTTDNLSGKRVLVLDDHDFNRQVLCDLLGRMGAHATSAENIPEAMTYFAAKPPDLVFIDLDLGERTGFEFAEWIRHKAPLGRDVPAIATTAFAIDEVRLRCEEAGMDGFVAKPVSAWKIREEVARIEHVRAGPATTLASAPAARPEPGSFIDLLSGGNAEAAAELRRKAWLEIRSEAGAAGWSARRGRWDDVAKYGHRLTSVAVLLGREELVAASKNLHAHAKNGDLAAARAALADLATLLRKERRSLKTGK